MGQATKRKRFSDGSRGNTVGNSINGAARKDERRFEAFKREEKSRKLTTQEKLDRLPKGGAARQRARYTELLAKESAKASQAGKEAKALVDSGEAVSLSEAKRKISQRRKEKAT